MGYFPVFHFRTSTIDDPTGGGGGAGGHGGHGGSGGDHALVEDDYDSDYGEDDFEDGENDGKPTTVFPSD